MNNYIEELELFEFQKHKHLLLNFKDGINVLHGASDKGKSAIRRAIEWCQFCETISGIRREGSKETKVRIKYGNGYELERVVSNSINRYILREPNKDDLIFNKFGRNIPDEIKEKLNIQTINIDGIDVNLNISRQLDAPFLIGRDFSGSFRQKLFNRLTGADLIDNVLKKLNIKIRKFNTDSKYAQEQLEKNEEDLKKVTLQYKEKGKLYGNLFHKYNKIKKLQEKSDNLSDLQEALIDNDGYNSLINKQLKELQVVDVTRLRGNIEKFDKLNALSDSLISNDESYIKVQDDLKDICPTTLNLDEIRTKIESFDALNNIGQKYIDLDENINFTEIKIEDIEKELKTLKSEKDTFLKDIKVCPLCGGKNE